MGLFLIIVFYVLGKWFGYETVIYGVPGTEHPVLETGYTIKIDDFDILYREDYSVHQYITDATIFDKAGTIIAEGPLQVNQPMRARALRSSSPAPAGPWKPPQPKRPAAGKENPSPIRSLCSG